MVRHSFAIRRAGFSLIEVLIAIMVLGIGLLMIAAIFPVGGNWTRQSTEETVAQSIAHTAVSLIQRRYGQTGDGAMALASASDQALSTLIALPGLTDFPAAERCYQFGSATPFPAQTPGQCAYFWTALVHKPAAEAGEGRSLDLYILVFHKGAVEQIFSAAATELPGIRASGDGFVPTVTAVPVTQANPVRPGEYALGEQSGTIYRRIVNSNAQADFQPQIGMKDSRLLIAPPADGTAVSPLVYVYQTTLSF
jgi:prepilin-type N-terminal cleavage/methylation domain-containing protein